MEKFMNDNKDLIPVKSQNKLVMEKLLQTQNCVLPLVDIYETDNEFILVASLPGLSREDVQVKIDDGYLVLFGKIKYDEAINRKYILNESEIGNYFRKFKVSDSIDKLKIEARYDNGQLKITLPKNDSAKTRSIEIN